MPAGWLIRRRRAVLGAALLAWAAGTVLSARLYGDLRSGVEELLPETAPSVVAARTVGPLLHPVTHLSVVVEGRDGDALRRFADDLAARLRRLPPGLVESVEYRTGEVEAFFRRFGGLYVSTADLDMLLGRLEARIAWERRRANPLLDLLDEEDAGPPPPVDVSGLERRYAPLLGARDRFRDGYFQTPDGRLLVLIVRPPETTGAEQNAAVLDAVRREVEAADPRRHDPAARVGYGGEVATLVEEQGALVADLASSTAVVVVLVLASLWAFFRRRDAVLAVLGALAVGCAITFGLAELLIGHLNANTAFLGSIVVGNGINVSIILVARYLEERRGGRPLEEAVAVAARATWLPTFVASFAAGLAYLSLAATTFRGFSQFGVIGGLGMALNWAVAYVLVPPLLAALEPRGGRPPAPPRRAGPGVLATLATRHARAVRLASLALLAAAAAGVATYRGDPIEYDLTRLRSARSLEEGAGRWSARVDEVFREYLTPIVIRAATPGDLERVAAALERRREALGEDDPLREVRTLQTLIPPDQEEKLPRLERLRTLLTDARLARLDERTRELARALRPPPGLRPITLADLPAPLRLPLVERDGTAGRIALAFPRATGWRTPAELETQAELVRGAIRDSGASAQAVGQSLLFTDIAAAIARDGPRATGLAFLAVLALVVIVLRRARPAVAVLASLLLGVAWLVGAAAWGRVRLNFLNFVVLPITFGIGVDYAVNVVQRWHAEGQGSLERVLAGTGGAVALCSLTTVIGYGSLLVADSRALSGFGFLASAGEVACAFAALLALPAWLTTLTRRRPTVGTTGRARPPGT